jgi:hypothetical protein
MGILKQRQLFILYLIAWAWQHTKKKIARKCSLKKGDCVVYRKGKGERRPAVVKKVVGKAISKNYDSPLGILFSAKPNRYFRRSFGGYPLPGGKRKNSNAQYFDTTHHSECHVKCGRRLKLAALSGPAGKGTGTGGGAVGSRPKSTRAKKQAGDRGGNWLFS